MTIQVDSREKKFDHVTDAFDRAGIEWFVSKLPCGDYANFDRQRVAVERKGSIQELCGNVCADHERFRDEINRADTLGIQLIILVEHSNKIKKLEDVMHWVNPRAKMSKYALDGPGLYKRLATISKRSNIPILFCTKEKAGETIINLLNSYGGKNEI